MPRKRGKRKKKKGGGGNSHQRAIDRAAKVDESPHTEAEMPTQSLKSDPQPSATAAERIFAFCENGIVLAVMGVIGGLCGVFVAGKYFMLLTIPLILGLHRSPALVGLGKGKKILGYFGVISISLPLLWLLGTEVDKSRAHISTVQEFSQAALNAFKSANAPQLIKAPVSVAPVAQDSHPKAQLVVPSVDMHYIASGPVIEFTNRGLSNVYIWGATYGDSTKDPSKRELSDPPRVINANGGSYYIYVNSLRDSLNRQIASEPTVDSKIPLDVYITMDDHIQRILKATLWVHGSASAYRVDISAGPVEVRKFKPQ